MDGPNVGVAEHQSCRFPLFFVVSELKKTVCMHAFLVVRTQCKPITTPHYIPNIQNGFSQPFF